MRRLAAGPAHRHRRGAAGLRPADPAHPDDRGRPSDPRRRRARGRRAGARARRRAQGRTIWCWCCCRAAHRPTGSRRRRAVARRQAGGDAGAAALGRQHRRDQHGAKASVRASRAAGSRVAAQPARVVTLAISDVPGDDPAVIGSGPTVPDPTTLADARAVVARYKLELPESVTRALADPAQRVARSPAIRSSPRPNSS